MISRNGEMVRPFPSKIPFFPFWKPGNMGVVCGLPGSGKTALLVLCALQAQKKGMQVVTNVALEKAAFQGYVKLNSDDPEKAVNQLWDLFDYIADEKDYRPRFLFLDELYKLVDSQNWKKATDKTPLFMQANKLGITLFVDNQTFGMTYNRIRQCSVLKVICEAVKLPIIRVKVGVIDVGSGKEEVFHNINKNDSSFSFPVDIYPALNLYNTRQLMYFGGSK